MADCVDNDDASTLAMLGVFVRRSSLILGVYALGYWGMSPAWLVGALVLTVAREKWRREKRLRRAVARHTALNSEQLTLVKLQDLPSWVHFPDVERVEWLNKMVKRLWPYIGDYVSDLLKTQWEPHLATTLAAYKLSNFQFKKIDLGDIPLRLGGVKVYSENVPRSEIIMDMEVVYAGDCRIECTCSRLSVGIKDLSINGTMRVVFKPLITQVPLVGGMHVFFLNRPDIDFNMLGLADVLDVPGLSGILRSAISDTVAAMMVLPNKWPIILSEHVNAEMMANILPEGVLRVRLIEAKQLMRKDRSLFGKGSSDPYVIATIGKHTFKTKTIKESIDPVWNFVCEAVIQESAGVCVELQLWDWDQSSLDKDERLGWCRVSIADVVACGSQNIWVPLEHASTGSVHIQLEWLHLSADIAKLEQCLLDTADMSSRYDATGLHSALLSVFVDSAQHLPTVPRADHDPSPVARLECGNIRHATAPKYRTTSPVWEQGFIVPLANPRTQSLKLQLDDQDSKKSLGSLTIDIKSLLDVPGLEVRQNSYMLKDSGAQSCVVLTLCLRIFSDGRSPAGSAGEKEKHQLSTSSSSLPESAVKESCPHSDIRAATVENSGVGGGGGDANSASDTTEPMEQGGAAALVTSTAPESSTVLRKRHTDNSASADDYRLGKIQLTVRYDEASCCLKITVHRITGLPMQSDDIPDPYVKLYLLPDRSERNKRKTKMIKDECNPVFEELFEYAVDRATALKSTLEVQVVSKKKFARNPVLGMLHIALASADLGSNVAQFYALKPEDSVNY